VVAARRPLPLHDLTQARAGWQVLLTPAMRRRLAAADLGRHPDGYGRLWWDRPAVTIKRECGHIGNGRYAHPEQDRQGTVREMAILQGFPRGLPVSLLALQYVPAHRR
jgi:site-specific DNA-cytosine methylase